MIWHLQLLTRNYLDYELLTKVSIEYEHLQFPSVTVCNQNPFRNSLIFSPNMTIPDAFKDYVHSLKESSEYISNKTNPGERVTHKRKKRDVLESKTTKPPFEANSTKDLEESETFQHEQQEDYGYGNSSKEFRQFETYSKALRLLNIITRLNLGHQREVMILGCSFNGLECSIRYKS